MDSITVLDLFVMLVGSKAKGYQASFDVLRSLYERAHSHTLMAFGALVALAGTVAGGLVSQLSQQGASNVVVAIILTIGLVSTSIWLFTLARRLRNLQREYLDILQVYNLLARFF